MHSLCVEGVKVGIVERALATSRDSDDGLPWAAACFCPSHSPYHWSPKRPSLPTLIPINECGLASPNQGDGTELMGLQVDS